LRHRHIKVVEIGKHNLYKFYLRPKKRPPKIGGPVRPHRSNVLKAGPVYSHFGAI